MCFHVLRPPQFLSLIHSRAQQSHTGAGALRSLGGLQHSISSPVLGHAVSQLDGFSNVVSQVSLLPPVGVCTHNFISRMTAMCDLRALPRIRHRDTFHCLAYLPCTANLLSALRRARLPQPLAGKTRRSSWKARPSRSPPCASSKTLSTPETTPRQICSPRTRSHGRPRVWRSMFLL